MVTRPSARLVAVVSAVLVSVACGAADAGNTAVEVLFRSSLAQSDGVTGTVFEGETLGLVCSVAVAPTTLAAVSVTESLVRLREQLAAGDDPVETPAVALPLPERPDGGFGTPCDLLLFDDANQNDRFDRGEAYVSAWSGGRGSFRAVFFSDPDTGGPGATAGWNLLEGGGTPTYHPVAGTAVPIDPVLVRIPR